MVLFLTGSVFAQQKHTHTVKAGETLYSISKTLKVSVAELKSWNKLVSNDLAVGQQLTYFVDGNDVQPPNGELPDEPVKSLIEISTPQENVYYTVKSGDNLTFIARRHNMSISELKELNNLETFFILVLSIKLVIGIILSDVFLRIFYFIIGYSARWLELQHDRGHQNAVEEIRAKVVSKSSSLCISVIFLTWEVPVFPANWYFLSLILDE